jgi:carboxymethylenebutenolidase
MGSRMGWPPRTRTSSWGLRLSWPAAATVITSPGAVDGELAHPHRVALGPDRPGAGEHVDQGVAPRPTVTDAPESPHRSAAKLTAELYLGFADQDPSMTAEQIATLERTLREAGVRYRVEVYAGAQHGDTMADHVAYDEAARERHFRELRALLQRTLG